MAGLELLYHSVAQDVSSPQDALVCFVHWELVRAGFKCLGTGDQPSNRVFKKEEELRHHIESAIVSPLVGTKQRAGGGHQKGKKSIRSGPGAQPHAGTNPLFIPPSAPQRQPP
ncbi:proteasome inhibitor PI31 subunit [Rhincodon typus]|uniref:proteasome inhibitor PI31 subunit n=1 Tax=Rhincodon typus TaxID=259920 RepID=UPI002030D48E|nr:proteasome inhibitor PI31 subunit [Rhincodon typus]